MYAVGGGDPTDICRGGLGYPSAQSGGSVSAGFKRGGFIDLEHCLHWLHLGLATLGAGYTGSHCTWGWLHLGLATLGATALGAGYTWGWLHLALAALAAPGAYPPTTLLAALKKPLTHHPERVESGSPPYHSPASSSAVASTCSVSVDTA
jgi:hypothetical protein